MEPMELEYAFFARHAEPMPDGTLVIVGADMCRIAADQMPAVLTELVLVAKLHSSNPDAIRFKFKLIGPNGEKTITSGDNWIEAVSQRNVGIDVTEGSRLVLILPAFVLEVAGDYVFTLTIDNGPVVDRTLKVVLKEVVS